MNDVTLKDYFKSSKNSGYKMSNYFLPGVFTNRNVSSKILDESILIPYEDHLNEYRKTYTFTNEEFRKYKYNPWKVSAEIYGTTELWFLVLHSNQMYSASEFCKQTVTMYTNDVLKLLQEITAVQDKEMRKATKDTYRYISNYDTIPTYRIKYD